MNDKLIKQHNAITTARYEMTAVEKNIVYMLLAQLYEKDTPNKLYYISVRELQKVLGKVIKYEQVQAATERLIGRVYHIHENKGLLQISLLASAQYIKGAGKIELELSKKIRPYLFALKRQFTTFRLHMALSLKSKYSKRIYEMLNQFKDTGIMKISVYNLKHRLELIDDKTGKERYTKWSMFIAKVLEIAKREIEEYTNLHFTYELQKTGRKYTDIIFKIKQVPIKIPQLYSKEINSRQETTQPIQERLINKYHLSPWQANRVTASVPIKEIHKTLYDIQVRMSDKDIKNIGGFTAKTFQNKYEVQLTKN